MIALLISLLLSTQGIPVQPLQGGTVRGVLRDTQGKPLAGVRIVAIARGDSAEEASSSSMAGLTETDELGRFTLENISPGRYSVAAGRLDLQTYYPGTQALSEARILTITAGATIGDINFALNDSSFGRSDLSSFGIITAAIALQVVDEDGGPLPVSAYGKPVSIRVDSATSTTSMFLGITAGVFPLSSAGEFRIAVENLPDTHIVKSITYGGTDITNGTFRLTPANFPTPASPANRTTVPAPGSMHPAASPPSNLKITLATSKAASTGGIRLSGRTGANSDTVYLSGKPGVMFSDGTFEFRGVPPGRHLIATRNSSTSKGAVVVVGNEDLEGVELKETRLLPEDFRVPKDPRPAGSYAAGTIFGMARISGTVLDERTKSPVSDATLEIRADARSLRIPVDANGRFESFYLLPGDYVLLLDIFAHSTRPMTITIDNDKDVFLELTTSPLK